MQTYKRSSSMSFHINPITHNAQECEYHGEYCKVTSFHGQSRDETFEGWVKIQQIFHYYASSEFRAVSELALLKKFRDWKTTEDWYLLNELQALDAKLEEMPTYSNGQRNPQWARMSVYAGRATNLLNQNLEILSQITQQWQVLALSPLVGRQGTYSKLLDYSFLIPFGEVCPSCGRTQQEVSQNPHLKYYDNPHVWRCWE